jgi:hypothetical protein
VAPIEAIVLIVWWAVDLINQDEGDGEAWYTFGRETLVMTVTQVRALPCDVISSPIFDAIVGLL